MNRRVLGWAVVLAAVVALGLWLRAPEPARPGQAPGSAVAVADPPQASSLELRVTSGGAPVVGAQVGALLGDELLASGRTDHDGRVTLGPLAPGRLRVVVRHPRHLPQERSTALDPGANRVGVELPAGVAIRARVSDSRGAVVGATVVAVQAETERGRCETSADGTCEVGELAPGSAVIRVHSGRHRPSQSEVPLPVAGTLVEHVVSLAAGRALSGRVVDDAGLAIIGAHVGSSDPGGALATSDEHGRFELTGLGDAPLNLFASAEGFAPRHVRALRPGSANVEIRLEKPASLKARVELASEAKSLMVSVCEYDTHFAKEICVARRVYEPPEATVVLEGLPAGSYDLLLEAPGHHPERVRVRLTPDRRSSIGEVRLRRLL